MAGPAHYRINVIGHVDPSWSSRLGGMKVMEHRAQDGEIETALEGYLADQAALSGVLNTLYNLHRPVISVQHVAEDPSQQKVEDESEE